MDNLLILWQLAWPSIALVLLVLTVIKLIQGHFDRKKEAFDQILEKYEISIFSDVDVTRTCGHKGDTHKWEELDLVTAVGGVPEERLVCLECGVISGGDKQFTEKGLEMLKKKIEEAKDLKAFYEHLNQYREYERERRANEYGLDKSVFLAGFNAFLEVEREIEAKINARREIESQKLLEKITRKSNQ